MLQNIWSMKRRRFRSGCVHHIYQRPVDGIVIFHTRRDFLVFLTLFFVTKRKYPVHVLSVCPMVDHIHVVLEADSKEVLSAFVQAYTSKFVKEYNRSIDRSSGRIFLCRFGCAPKRDDKEARTAIAYSYNNAPERKLCEKAIDYQWNMLAYAGAKHPFSEAIVLSKASLNLRKALKQVEAFHHGGYPLGYFILDKMFDGLKKKEVLQLTDFILHTYCDVDFDRSIRYYGDLPTMILAIDSNTGCEYSIKEDWVGYSDTTYATMGMMARNITGMKDMKAIMKMPVSKRRDLFEDLMKKGDFLPRQVEKYLQLPVRAKR